MLPAAASQAAEAAPTSSYTTSIAHTPEQIRAAQRLRYQVFAEERGAKLDTPLAGHDIDEFDELMDHLIVTEQATGEIVGTYRLLPPGRSDRLFSDTEFDLSGLPAEVRGQLVEAGRACVHRDHRAGSVITQMWAGLARYVLLSGHRYLAGCASVTLEDGGQAAVDAWELARGKHAAPAEMLVRPRDPWLPGPGLTGRATYQGLPPLLRGYLRVGAWLCGAPQHERDFHDADFYVLLDTQLMNERYRRYFLGDTAC